VVLGHLPIERTADPVRDSLIPALQSMPAGMKKTPTWDQGAKTSEHRTVSLATNMAVHFCERASPWQRGTNENPQRVAPAASPQSTNLRTQNAAALAAIADEPNSRREGARMGYPRETDECFTEHQMTHTVATTAEILGVSSAHSLVSKSLNRT